MGCTSSLPFGNRDVQSNILPQATQQLRLTPLGYSLAPEEVKQLCTDGKLLSCGPEDVIYDRATAYHSHDKSLVVCMYYFGILTYGVAEVQSFDRSFTKSNYMVGPGSILLGEHLFDRGKRHSLNRGYNIVAKTQCTVLLVNLQQFEKYAKTLPPSRQDWWSSLCTEPHGNVITQTFPGLQSHIRNELMTRINWRVLDAGEDLPPKARYDAHQASLKLPSYPQTGSNMQRKQSIAATKHDADKNKKGQIVASSGPQLLLGTDGPNPNVPFQYQDGEDDLGTRSMFIVVKGRLRKYPLFLPPDPTTVHHKEAILATTQGGLSRATPTNGSDDPFDVDHTYERVERVHDEDHLALHRRLRPRLKEYCRTHALTHVNNGYVYPGDLIHEYGMFEQAEFLLDSFIVAQERCLVIEIPYHVLQSFKTQTFFQPAYQCIEKLLTTSIARLVMNTEIDFFKMDNPQAGPANPDNIPNFNTTPLHEQNPSPGGTTTTLSPTSPQIIGLGNNNNTCELTQLPSSPALLGTQQLHQNNQLSPTQPKLSQQLHNPQTNPPNQSSSVSNPNGSQKENSSEPLTPTLSPAIPPRNRDPMGSPLDGSSPTSSDRNNPNYRTLNLRGQNALALAAQYERQQLEFYTGLVEKAELFIVKPGTVIQEPNRTAIDRLVIVLYGHILIQDPEALKAAEVNVHQRCSGSMTHNLNTTTQGFNIIARAGDYFNELGLVTSYSRPYGIKTVSNCIYLTLTRLSFERLISNRDVSFFCIRLGRSQAPLEAILSHPQTSDSFYRLAQSEHSTENLDFYKKILEFRSKFEGVTRTEVKVIRDPTGRSVAALSYPYLFTELLEIYNQFIRPDHATAQVNLPHHVVDQIRESIFDDETHGVGPDGLIEGLTHRSLDQALAEVILLMRRDIFTRYVVHDTYLELLKQFKPYEHASRDDKETNKTKWAQRMKLIRPDAPADFPEKLTTSFEQQDLHKFEKALDDVGIGIGHFYNLPTGNLD